MILTQRSLNDMTSVFDLISVSYFSFLKRRNFSDHIVQLQFSHRFCLKDSIRAEGEKLGFQIVISMTGRLV